LRIETSQNQSGIRNPKSEIADLNVSSGMEKESVNVTRGKYIPLLVLLMIVGGAACLWAGEVNLRTLTTVQMPLFTAGILFFLAACAGLLSLANSRTGQRRLARNLSQMVNQGKLAYVDCPSTTVMGLTAAVNDAVSYAERAVDDAKSRVDEIAIELKVALAARHHAEAILHSISDAVLVTDVFDEVVLANEAAAKAFGFNLAESTRSPIDKLLKDQKMIELIRDMRQGSTRNTRRIIEHAMTTPAGGNQAFKVTFAAVPGQDNKAAGVVAVLHDMTKEKEVAAMKNDFVSHVSHELRTPLASIKAYVEMLIDGEAEDEKTEREFYDIIQSEANRLGRLIDNILNISRIESGLVKINKQPHSLMVILKEAVEVITPQSTLKNITLTDKLPPVFYQVLADKDTLYQGVLNLLSNAVKYTPDGGRISVVTSIDEATRRVTVKITDTGVGIPPKDLPFVFDKFYRVEANNKMAKGTGLGLSLVKHIVETVHQGTILAESEVGKGSCFGFELDLLE